MATHHLDAAHSTQIFDLGERPEIGRAAALRVCPEGSALSRKVQAPPSQASRVSLIVLTFATTILAITFWSRLMASTFLADVPTLTIKSNLFPEDLDRI